MGEGCRREEYVIKRFIALLTVVPLLFGSVLLSSCEKRNGNGSADTLVSIDPNITANPSRTENTEHRVLVVFAEVPAEGESEEDYLQRMLDIIGDSFGRCVSAAFGFSEGRYSASMTVSTPELRKLKSLPSVAEVIEEEKIDPPRPVTETKDPVDQ